MAGKLGYNGKEISEELGLDTYDFGARNYNPDLGRWMNIDPLAARYDAYSAYSFTINNPIYFVDPDGKQIIIYYNSNGKNKSKKYNYEKNRKTEDLPVFLANALTALDGLYEASNIDTTGDGENDTNVLDELIGSDKELSIVSGKTTSFNKGISRRSSKRRKLKDQYSDIGTLFFDDKNGVLFDDVNDSGSNILQKQLDSDKLSPTSKINSPMSVLGHDLLHAFNYLGNKKAYYARVRNKKTKNGTPYFRNEEEQLTTTLSTQINRNLKENDRKNHRGIPVPVQGVKSNKIKKKG